MSTLSPGTLRLTAALIAAKATSRIIRALGRGGGTAAPGLVAERIDPSLLTRLTSQLTQGTVIVAGTNGKTTTTRIIADMYGLVPWRVVHNRSGSNLVRGVVSAFIQQASPTGRPNGEIGVIEADEAALPALMEATHPRIVLLNNLFRDQLDRYGELDAIARTWQAALATLPPSSTVIINADDPALCAITDGIAARRVCFGLTDPAHQLDELPHAADAAVCRSCGTDLHYDQLYVAHLGAWSCPGCGRQRPPLDYTATDIRLIGVTSLTMTVRQGGENGGARQLQIALPGLYNAYNVLAAVTASREAGVSWPVIDSACRGFTSAFGRIERISYQGHQLTMALVKNPTGFNEVIRMLTAETGEIALPTLFALNDNDADGRDVSWLWDVDFERLAPGRSPLMTTGRRGPDIATRLKYAGADPARIISLDNDTALALEQFVRQLPAGTGAYILPSYTAMLAIRRYLVSQHAVTAFWEQ